MTKSVKGSVTLFTTVQVRFHGLDVDSPMSMVKHAEQLRAQSSFIENALNRVFDPNPESADAPVISSIQEDPDLAPFCQVFQGPMDEGEEFLFQCHPLTKELVPMGMGNKTLAEQGMELASRIVDMKKSWGKEHAVLPDGLDELIERAEAMMQVGH